MYYISYQKLQLVENINLFRKVEDDIGRNLFEQHLQRIYIEEAIHPYSDMFSVLIVFLFYICLFYYPFVALRKAIYAEHLHIVLYCQISCFNSKVVYACIHI